MNEETKTEETKEEVPKPTEDSGDGVHEETVSELDRADSIAERQKRENDRREKLLEREEALEARRAVGGKTDAGQETKKKEEPESDVDYANKVMAGDLNAKE